MELLQRPPWYHLGEFGVIFIAADPVHVQLLSTFLESFMQEVMAYLSSDKLAVTDGL